MTTTSEFSRLDMIKRIEGLTGSVFRHEALNNEFYRRWMGETLTYPEVRVFAVEYLSRTVQTSVMVALSVLQTEDRLARVECVKNLFSEYGNGDPEKVHLTLLENFLSNLLGRLAGRPVPIGEIYNSAPLKSTEAFSTGQRSLFASDDQRVVQGALLAQEWLAYSMIVKLYEGVHNYKSYYDSEESFHEACEYFYIHIGEAEKDHKIQALESVSQVCQDEGDLQHVEAGFREFLRLTADYWRGVTQQMLLAASL